MPATEHPDPGVRHGQARRVLVTAGPTREPIDRVRYVGNRSSGRMGVAIAAAAARAGHSTTLLLGPGTIALPGDASCTVLRFETTADLAALLDREWPEHDVLIMAAAVADYRPVAPTTDTKIRRTSTTLTIEMEPTPDLLAALADDTRDDQTVIGFALEPADDLLPAARRKLERKHLDAIVANPLETMEGADVEAVLVRASGDVVRPEGGRLSKAAFAEWLIRTISRW